MHLLQRSVEPKNGEWNTQMIPLANVRQPLRKTFHVMHAPLDNEKTLHAAWSMHGNLKIKQQMFIYVTFAGYKRKMPKGRFVTTIFLVWIVSPWQPKKKNKRTNQSSKPRRPTHASENQGSHLTNKACKAQTDKVMYVVLAQKVSSSK